MRFVVDAQLPVALVDRLKQLGHDSDFRHAHETGGHPTRLLLISAGNVRNRDLYELIAAHHDEIMDAFTQADFVELGTRALTLHPRRGTGH